MPQLPTPIRAALGLAATAVAEARKLPETLPQLPVAAISTAMQTSLRVQQHIATLATRGDEVISQLRGTSNEAPSWATFDDGPEDTRAAFDRVSDELDQLGMTNDLAGSDADLAGTNDLADLANTTSGAAEPAHPIDQLTDGEVATPAGDAVLAGGPVPEKAPAKKAAVKKAPAKKAPAKKAPAKKAEPLAEAAKKADPDGPPTPSTMAAEILHAHQLEDLPGGPETDQPTE